MAHSTSTYFKIITTYSPTTVVYGTRRATSAIHYDEHDGSNDEKTQSAVLPKDNCPNNTVICDGKEDCQHGTDEAYCGKSAHS